MNELWMLRLQEIIVIVIAVSLVFYVIDFLKKNTRMNRIGTSLLITGWSVQTLLLLYLFINDNRFPILSLEEGFYFYAWLLLGVTIALKVIWKLDIPALLFSCLGFVFLVIHTFGAGRTTGGEVSEYLISELLIIHITFAILAYVAFSVSFVFSILYLVLYRMLKKKKWTAQFARLPSLAQAEAMMTYSIIAGIPLLFVSLLLGLEWGYIAIDGFNWLDSKIVTSFLLLVVYLFVFITRERPRIVGTTYAWIHVYAFLFVLINFFLGSSFSEFHLW
ncbi:cytochrome c biogenesis protein CcsA [Chryseomicrobium sp. FSL W7-1435]|uniref:cytochrome c biogenesis protein CcsA n=1 Tax=Chryseomicrobium sp. FSL W7-1435 TaxID=2921704 RepID=UPI00315A9714